ncbi:MAG: ABC transporter substrate-binding protein [Chloroflexota bacterium]
MAMTNVYSFKEKKMKKSFLLMASVLVLGLLIVACGGGEPQIVEVTREVEVEVETVVETEVEVEVTREVEVVRIEEIETEVQVTVEVEVIADYQPEGTIQTAAGINHITWDPHGDQRTISLQYLNPVYEGLLREANDGASFVPELATRWEEDETGVTFSLRQGVTFHDGEPFNADAVVANFDRIKEVGHPVNRGFLRNVESAEAIDEFTVRYNYSEFDGTVLLTLSRFSGKMISPAAFENVNDGPNPVGTGPYIYNAEDSAQDNTFKVFDFNPNYWNNNAQPFARLELTHITDTATRYNGLFAGEFHIVGGAGVAALAAAEADGYVVSGQPAVAWSAHILDRTGSTVPELADERVRLAMALAVDRPTYWQVVDPGQPSTQHALPGGYAYNPDIMDLNLNMERAKELMAEAGNPTFEINMPSFGFFGTRNAYFASSWEELGITVNIIEIQNIFAGCQQNQGDVPMQVGVCPINERHIKHFVENRLLETGFLNPFGHVDEEINELYNQAKNLPLDEAEPLYAEIARISAEKAYIIHLGWAESPVVYDPQRISGVQARFIYPGTINWGDVTLLDSGS